MIGFCGISEPKPWCPAIFCEKRPRLGKNSTYFTENDGISMFWLRNMIKPNHPLAQKNIYNGVKIRARCTKPVHIGYFRKLNVDGFRGETVCLAPIRICVRHHKADMPAWPTFLLAIETLILQITSIASSCNSTISVIPVQTPVGISKFTQSFVRNSSS